MAKATQIKCAPCRPRLVGTGALPSRRKEFGEGSMNILFDVLTQFARKNVYLEGYDSITIRDVTYHINLLDEKAWNVLMFLSAYIKNGQIDWVL
jgi:hypothetical protein